MKQFLDIKHLVVNLFIMAFLRIYVSWASWQMDSRTAKKSHCEGILEHLLFWSCYLHFKCSHTQSDNHIVVNDDSAASSRCRPTLKLLKGKLCSITQGLLFKRWPLVHGRTSLSWPVRILSRSCCDSLTFHCPDEAWSLSSSSWQFLYSYEIFLVLSAIYITYTILKLPSDASFFFRPPMPGIILSTQGKQMKRRFF